MKNRLVDPLGDQTDRHVARGRDVVEGVRRDAELQQLAAYRRRGTRRVGDQDDRPAAAAKRDQSASEAEGKAATPLCTTPQMSHRMTS